MPMQFHFTDLSLHHDEAQVGHRFTLRVGLSQRRGARLAWFERSDRHDNRDIPQDTWVDMHRLFGADWPVFQPWLETSVDGGRTELEFPALSCMPLQPYARRTLEWCVVVVDGEDEQGADDGTREWAMWRGVQELACDGEGRVFTHTLSPVQPLHGRSDQPPHPDDCPQY
jgi:hypothetical protein